MSDLYNSDAELVTLAEFNAALRSHMGPGVILPSDEYARIQLLSEASARRFVRDCFSVENTGPLMSLLVYGEFVKDWPLCTDFAKTAVVLLLLFAAKVGLGVRASFFRLHYTKTTGGRHAIIGLVRADGSVSFIEPQGMKWLDEPVDLKSYDKVSL